MNILAIETSADETAAAVVRNGTDVISSTVSSSIQLTAKYGGIVPELAARKQLDYIQPVIAEALEQAFGSGSPISHITSQIAAVAVTVGPGLIGSLLVGVEAAKAIGFATGKPVIPVNHVLAHMYANFVNAHPTTDNTPPIQFPAISLVVSGGHTELYCMNSPKKLTWLGGTLDDAAGECFDKAARLLGFGGRGGSAIQEAAAKYTHDKSTNLQIKLPRPMLTQKDEFNFSFSGLKTAILRGVNSLQKHKQFSNTTMQQLAFEIQEAITDVLVKKTMLAVSRYNARSVLLSGGVAANLRLREKMITALTQFNSVSFHVPPVPLCTDNAVAIASYAFFRGKPVSWQKITAAPDLSVEIT